MVLTPSHTHQATTPSDPPIYKFGPYPSTHLTSATRSLTPLNTPRSGDEEFGKTTFCAEAGDAAAEATAAARRPAAAAIEVAEERRLADGGGDDTLVLLGDVGPVCKVSEAVVHTWKGLTWSG